MLRSFISATYHRRGHHQPPRLSENARRVAGGGGMHAFLARHAAGPREGAAKERQADDPAVDGRRPEPVRHVQSQAGLANIKGRRRRSTRMCRASTSASIGRRRPRCSTRSRCIRSMVSDEKDHFRAIKLVRTGYPIKPTIAYPTWGSVVARDRWDPGFDLPAFVRIGKPRIKTRDVNSGVLGPRYESFKIDEPGKLPEDVHPAVAPDVLQRRLALAAKLDEQFAARGSRKAAIEQREIYDRTSRFVLSPLLDAFNLDKEPEKLRDAYGRNAFGQGCLLARRLVEAGVSFVEVINGGTLNDQGWDTHKRGFKENPILAGETDSGYATLLTDLADRGMLDNTLVVWMGEFCRTPKYEDDAGGRNHYSEGWLVGLSGGGVKMGQVDRRDRQGQHPRHRPPDQRARSLLHVLPRAGHGPARRILHRARSAAEAGRGRRSD